MTDQTQALAPTTRIIVVTVTEPHTGRRWTYEHRLAAEAERLAARMRAAGFRASVGRAR